MPDPIKPLPTTATFRTSTEVIEEDENSREANARISRNEHGTTRIV